MEKGIYKYSPTLQFEIGRLGSAFVNLCTQSPSLYIDLPLYESQSIGGLNLHCYVLDTGSTYEAFTFNCTFKFSYDVSLTVSSSTELCINNPSGSKHKYQLNTTNNRYESLEDKSYIVSLYNEETCLTTYTLFDESENENVFLGNGTTLYLNTIKLKNGKEITITRDTSNRVLQIDNPLSNERIKFAYYESIITVQVKTLTDNQKIYEFIYYIDNNENFEIVYYSSNVHRYVTLICSQTSFLVQEEALGGDILSTNTFTRNSTTNKITKFTDNCNNNINISYGNRYATVTNNRNDEQIKYVWDHIGRLTHVYDLKRNTFSNISYDSYNHEVIKSSNLCMTKIINPNYIGTSIGKTTTFYYEGKVNDVFSVIIDASYNYTLQFKVQIIFEKLDDTDDVIESDSVEPYDYDIYNYGTSNPYVFSTYSNINFNRVKVVITETQGSGTYSVYLYNAGFTESYLYKGKILVGALKYGTLTGITTSNSKVISSPSGFPEYDEKDRIIKFTDSYGNVMEYTYDENDNVLTVKTRKGSYVTTKTYTYDSTNNRLLTEKDDSVSSLTKSTTLDNRGLFLSSKVINSSNVEFEGVTAEYNSNSTPLYSKLTQIYNHNNDSNLITDVIEYTYENKELVKATFDDRSVSYTINEKTHNYDNVKLNNTKFVEYTYKTKTVSGVEIATELIESKTYQNGTYYFEYDSNDRLVLIKYSTNKNISDAITINTFTYEKINNNDVLKSTSLYNNTTQDTYFTEYKYDKYGNYIGKNENNETEHYNGFKNDYTKIEQFNSRCLFTKKDDQRKIYKMKFNQKIRSLDENIKLCSFDTKFRYKLDDLGNTGEMYAVLFNNIIEEEIDESNSEYVSQKLVGFENIEDSPAISSKYTIDDISYINICGNETPNEQQSKNLIFSCDIDNNMFDSSSQTISFMFRNNYCNSKSSTLLTLKNYDSLAETSEQFFNNSDDIYMILENKNNSSKIKVCKFSSISDEGVSLDEIESLTTELVIDNGKWHFVSLTYTPNKLSLFVDGTLKEIQLNPIYPNRNINMIYFGQCFPNNYNGFETENTSASFDLTNIMVPYKKALSNDRIKDIYNMFETRNEYVSNDLLDANNNDKSNTTFHTITQNIFSDNIEYISFSKTLSSLHGLKPKVDRTLTSLSDTILDKFVFDEETLNYAYKLCGQSLEYELESSKYKDSFGVSFMLKVNSDDVGQHNIMKFLSEELSFAIAYIDGKLVFETTGSNPKELDINKNQWVLITLEMGKTIDNCSNQVYEYTFDLYINGNWKHRNKVQLDTEFEGFDELVFDFNDTHNCFNETPCLIKDMIITDADFTSTQMNNMLKMNNKSYINTQFDSLELKTKETICELGNTLIETTFGYETNTRFKDELIKLPKETSNSRKYTYVFNDYGRATEQKTLKQSSENIFDSTYNWLRYNYDARGQLITDIINHNELPSGIAHQYTYDKYGNIESYKVNGNTVHSFAYDEYNRMIIFDNKIVTYNDNDGMISLTPSTIGDDTYSWQGRRLMSISGTKNIQFEYNDQGLRTFKRVDTGQTLNSNKIYKDYEYVYDLDNKLICQRVTYLNSIDTMIFLYHDDYLYGFEYAQSKYFYLRDSLGNINGIIDSTGKLVVEYVYNAFGKIIDILGEMKDTIGVNNPMRYKGYYYDSETQMYYCKSRYYNPDFCRWVSGDAEKFIDTENSIGINFFVYCHNDPVNYYDMSGYSPKWVNYLCWGIAIALVVAAGVALMVASGGSAAVAVSALVLASSGLASSTVALTVTSFMFLGASIAFASTSLVALMDGELLESGPDVLISTFSAGLYGAYGGYHSWNQQIKGLEHSPTTEARHFWKREANDPKSIFYQDERALKGLTPTGYQLHHPYGRFGSKIRIYCPVTVDEHKQIHKTYGYGQKTGGYNQHYNFDNIWEWLKNIF